MGNCLPKPKKKGRVKPARTHREENECIDKILSKSSQCPKRNQNEPADMAKALKVEETDENNTAAECPPNIKKALAFTVDLVDDTPKIVSPDGPVDNKNATACTAEIDEEGPKNVLPDSLALTKKALAFTVDIGDGQPKTTTPKQLAEKESISEIVYTNDEESLMDAILMEMGDIKSEDTKVVDPKKTYTLDEKSLMADIMREDRLKEIKEKARQEEVKIYDAKRRRMAKEKSKEARVESKTASCVPDVDVQRKKVRDLASEDRRKAVGRRRMREEGSA